MAKFCFVVERLEWDEDFETGVCWEDRDICRVFENYEDAKSYVESNAKGVPYPMHWKGDKVYSGRTAMNGKAGEGLRYELHYVAYN